MTAPPPRTPSTIGATLTRLVPLLISAILAVLAVALVAPQDPAPAGVPHAAFSAARAENDLAVIAAEPHPLGSPRQQVVREHLLARLAALGVPATVETDRITTPEWGSPYPVAEVHNIVARIAGTAPAVDGAILVVAHYDSAPGAPGAADDGAAVAAMLESLRALKTGAPLRRDVVFVFTDGEELGALGARAYVRRHGATGIATVLNWEARGSSGPSLMFETGTGDAHLIEALAGAGVTPVATSVSAEVYRRMPNGSDFTVFRDAGATGLNFAFIEGLADYHRSTDDLTRLSRASLQEHGDTMLALVRTLGDATNPLRAGHGAVYFDLFGRQLISYPATWALPLAALTVLGLMALLALGFRRHTLRPAALAASAGGALLLVLGAAAIAFALWRAALVLSPDTAAMPLDEPYFSGWYATALLLAAAALFAVVARFAANRLHAGEWTAGTALLWAALLLVTVVLSPGASYLFQWVLLAALPVLWPAERPLVRALAATAPLAVAAVLYAPLTGMLLTALGIPLAAVAVGVAALGALPAAGLEIRTHRFAAPGLAIFAAATLVVTAVRPEYSTERPRPNALIYVRDTSDGTTRWLSPDAEPDAWTRTVLGDDPATTAIGQYFPFEPPAITAPAPAIDLPAPVIEPVGAAGGTVTFHVSTRRAAWMLQVRVERAAVTECRVAGERIDPAAWSSDGPHMVVQWWGTATAELACDLRPGRRLTVDALDLTHGLPPAAAALIGPRPDGSVGSPYGYAPIDAAVVRSVRTL